jgi:ethanolamine utilization protein EutQ
MGKQVITEADVVAAAEAGSKIIEAPLGECIVTYGAKDKALSLGVVIHETSVQGDSSPSVTPTVASSQTEEVISQVASLIKDRVPLNLDPEKLENLVRQVATVHLSESSSAIKHNPDQSVTQMGGVCFIKGNMIPSELSGSIPVDEKVMVMDAFKCSDDSTLAGGYMEWSKASFNRMVDQNEINIVLEGELNLSVDGQTSVVKQGDMVYLPRGTEVLYSAPGRVKLACVNSLNK